jgi:hypothetical protein
MTEFDPEQVVDWIVLAVTGVASGVLVALAVEWWWRRR